MDKKELLDLLKPEAQQVDAAMTADLENVGSADLAEVLRYAIFTGGKRVRPLLAVFFHMLSSGAHNKESRRGIYRLAMVFEYLHAASLLHDDVIDHAAMRRGKTAANKVWGNTRVILAGDYLHAGAMRIAGGEGGVECLEATGRATAAMVEAEFLQMRNAGDADLAENDYFAVLMGKTAALIAAACEAGVLYACGTAAERDAAKKYGVSLGLAFQVVDDLLDYLGDPGRTGKAVGNDFVEAKMTLPLIYAMRNAEPSGRARIAALLMSDQDKRAAGIPEVVAFIEENKGFEQARAKARAIINEALTALEIFPDISAGRILTGLAGYVLSRDK